MGERTQADSTDPPEPTAWQRLERLWEELNGLPEAARQDFLDHVAAGDPAVHAELQALAASADRAEAFFGRLGPLVDAGISEVLKASLFDGLQAGVAGRYALDREIGEGGMATVFLARDLRHDRDVALKVFKPELAATLGVDRFNREIEIAAGLRHPHILPVYDSGEAGSYLYYVMPYEPGRSLRERLAREDALSVDDAVRILRDVVDALAHAHEHGIVHRDIKPENVLLSARYATVADFGVAKAVAEAARGSHATAAGLAIGTPRYMAPEQAAGDSAVDHRADIYAVGVLAYEILAGQPPFIGDTAHEVMSAHLTQPPPPLTVHRPAVPAALAAIVMKCLEKKPGDRWQSAQDLLAHLESLGASTPVAKASVAVAPARRVPRAWLAAVVVTLAALVALTLVARRGSSPPGEAPGPSIAVLPLVNRGDADEDALADGMTVELISKIASAGLRPIASTSVFAYRERHADVRAIADSLGVPYLLEGDWQKVGSILRIRIALIGGSDRSTLWSQSYDREFRDVLAIQDEIARAVAREVGLRLGVTPAARQDPARAVNPAAYELYLLGSDRRLLRTDSASRLGLEYFRRAIAIDSTFAAAYAGLAFMYIRVSPRESPDMPRHQRVAIAERLVRKALALDPELPMAHDVLGVVHMYRFRFAQAERSLRQAIALDPSRPEPRERLSLLYVWVGRFADVLEEATLALQLDPLSPIAHAQLARAYLVNDRCDEAMRQLEHIANVDPPVGRARLVAAQCLGRTGRWDEAIAQFQQPEGELIRGTEARGLVGWVLARAGRTEEALTFLETARDHAERTEGDAFDVALVYAGLRDFDQAFAWLERSIDDQSMTWMIMEPFVEDVRQDPRFDRLMRRIGLQKR